METKLLKTNGSIPQNPRISKCVQPYLPSVPDHLLLQWQEQTRGIWECWSLLAALAAATSRVELGPLVTCAAFRVRARFQHARPQRRRGG